MTQRAAAAADKARKAQASPSAAPRLDARTFITRLKQHQSDDELRKIQRYFKSGKGEYGEGDTFIGVRMGTVFALAKEFMAMGTSSILPPGTSSGRGWSTNRATSSTGSHVRATCGSGAPRSSPPFPSSDAATPPTRSPSPRCFSMTTRT
jgi:hypothetical protein